MSVTNQSLEIIQDPEASAAIIRHAGEWMATQGIEVSEWWDPAVITTDFLSAYAQPHEFYVAELNGVAAATAIIQEEQCSQNWTSVDGEEHFPAMYIHWVAVNRSFAGQGLPRYLINHAEALARQQRLPVLRLDTNANEPKLRRVYGSLGFRVANEVQEDNHRTVLYERPVVTAAPFNPEADDANALAVMHLGMRLWQVWKGENTFSNILESQADIAGLSSFYVAPGGNFFVAKDSTGEVAGFMGLRNVDGKGVIKRLAVHPAYQRRGIGRLLVGEALDWAEMQGIHEFSLHTNIGENARSIYEEFGFVVKGFVEEHEDWYMEKRG